MFYVLLSFLYVHSSIAIILMGKRELIALLNLSSWCLVMVKWLFLAVPRGSLQFVIVVFPDHTHLLFQEFSSGGGVQVSLTKKTLTTFFFCCFFLVLSLFYRSQMVNFKEMYHFSQTEGSNIFPGGGGVVGSNFFQGGGGPIDYSL